MDAADLLIALRLIVLHNVEGAEVHIAPQHIVTLRDARASDRSLVSDKVRCFISLTDGKYLTVVETCDAVRKLMEGAKP
jgi:hypothetical protein